MTTPLAWSGRDWRMPVWLWVGLATMFFSALHIILDFGVGLFDLHGTRAFRRTESRYRDFSSDFKIRSKGRPPARRLGTLSSRPRPVLGSPSKRTQPRRVRALQSE